MKKAYTNTVKKTSAMSLSGRSGASKQSSTMPKCQYGAACTRKGCIYRHPPRGKSVGKVGKKGACKEVGKVRIDSERSYELAS